MWDYLYYYVGGLIVFVLYVYYVFNPDFVRTVYSMMYAKNADYIYEFYEDLMKTDCGRLITFGCLVNFLWKICGLLFTFQYSIFLVMMMVSVLLNIFERIITNDKRENLKDWQISVRALIDIAMITFVVKNGLVYHFTLF